jgi:membrane-bound lytic murein transglycosylase A
MFSRWLLLAGLLFGAGVLAACAPKPVIAPPPLERLAPADYPDFHDALAFDHLDRGIAMSLAYLRKLPPDRLVPFGEDTYAVAHLIRSLETFSALIARDPGPRLLNRMIREQFRVYRAAGRMESKKVLFTGYYTPVLQGSVAPSADFAVPVHSRPKDLVEIDLSLFAPDLEGRRIVGRYAGQTVTPYPDRAGIGREPGFDRIAPPVAWVHDEIDLFMMMVQGSGTVALENGDLIQLQFAGSNGRPYRSIGRLLIDQGKIHPDEMSMQAIRAYLRQNPGEVRTVLDHNPRYIFFRRIPQGPLGALGCR